MTTPAKHLGVAATVLAVAATLAACSTGAADQTALAASSPGATPTAKTEAAKRAESQAEYEAARVNYTLPDGYEWPEKAPYLGDSSFNISPVQMVWSCIRIDAAWAAIDAGDQAKADAIVAPVYKTSIWSSDPPTFDGGQNARFWGWHGVCAQELGIIDYPVKGLKHWSPRS